MNSDRAFLPATLAALLLIESALGDSPPQPPVSFAEGSEGTWNADWSGIAGRTYFAEGSTDLANWAILPVLKFGPGLKGVGFNTDGAAKYFMRLIYEDFDWVATEQEARDADFDGDGIPNWFEVEELGSDPLDKDSAGGDSDGDGMADGWELYYFTNLTTVDPDAKLVPDGLTNKEKSGLGLNPLSDDLTLMTERISYSYDGEHLDGVNYYTQRGFGYGVDGNGNVETTTSD